MGYYERVAYNYFISFVIVNIHIRGYKEGLVRHIIFLTVEVEQFIQPILQLGFCLG